ncbi:putative gustatory receptor 22b [Drosophila takahashii]|uniref:putative gustatory receptor 22b n=1 Tax=Drosophila takahashii TaxID=29030 RepID=UPI001CF82979|nr:putative gustatory receptor 22b [Drosophila takahashii]
MFGSRREFRPYLARIILESVLYGSWLGGLFPFIFDSERRKVRRSRWLVVYGLVVNYLVLFVLLFLGFQYQNLRKLDAFERNPVLERVNVLITLMSLFSAVVINFMNFWGSKKVEEIVNELLTLEYHDFRGLNEKNCPKLNCFVIQKWAAMVGQLISFLTVNYGMPGNRTHISLVLLSCWLQVSVCFNIMQYYFGVLLIYRYVWLINGQLGDLLNQLNLNPTIASSRIRNNLSLYNRLLDLNKKLVSAYEYHMILILTSWLAGNIVVSFFLIVYGISMQKCSIFLMVFPQSLLINVWDFWLTIAVCDLTERTGRKTSTVLKHFTDIDYKDDQLEKSVNEFAWLCSHRKFQFQLCGLFHVNYNMGFQMTISSFLYLVYLVQFDFMNL